MTQNQNTQNKPQRSPIDKMSAGNMSFLAAICLTALNLVLLLVGSYTYFPFSIFSPYFITCIGDALSNPEKYGGDIAYSMGQGPLVFALVVSILIIAVFFLCWFLSRPKHVIICVEKAKRGRSMLIVALVLYCIDFVVLGYDIFAAENVGSAIASSVIDIAFHAWMIYYFVSQIKAVNLLVSAFDKDGERVVSEPTSFDEADYKPANDTIQE